MELARLTRWNPAARFSPDKNDFIFVGRSGLYAHYDRVTLIVRWRDVAEKEALNAILLMMVETK